MVAWLAGTAGLLPAQSRPWSIADRAIVGSFTRISSIAVAPDRVYVSSPTALLIWDPRLRRWDGPFTPPDSSTLDRVFTALVDPLNNSLWLARVDGWVHFDPYRLNWQTGPVPAVVQGIAFDFDAPGAGLFVRTEQGWGVVAPGKNQFSPSQPPKRPLQPPTVTEALAAVPALRAGVAPGGGGQGGRAASYSAAARAFGGHGWYLGTWGDGLFSLLEGAVTPERLRFGLPGERVSAVAVAAGGVWVATDWSVGPGQTLSFVASDLSEFRWTAPGVKTERSFGAVRALAAQGPVLWGATDQGLARWNTEPAEFELIGGSRGLPDS
ncbi:MAG TPA: hypothetical protein VEG33_08250, partial [Streptosporangiaceae bacterium]|nr:hypothetical protein [Streptosporangiaceae bacterium]